MEEINILRRFPDDTELSDEQHEELLEIAKKNDNYARIQARLAFYYMSISNYGEAYKWNLMAMNGNNVSSILQMAYMYSHGLYVEQNYTLSFHLQVFADILQKYSNLYSKYSISRLMSYARSYYNGYGVDKNYYISYKLYKLIISNDYNDNNNDYNHYNHYNNNKTFAEEYKDELKAIAENMKYIEENYPNIQVDYSNSPILK